MDKIVESLVKIIDEKIKDNNRIIIAIDGRAASGKTTLAKYIEKLYDCNLIHMDYFFLRPDQRSEERLKIPGGNVDYERFLEEVLSKLRNENEFTYRPYNCKTQSFDSPVFVSKKQINIVEGSYSCHPELWDYYDVHIFLSVDYKEQLERIKI